MNDKTNVTSKSFMPNKLGIMHGRDRGLQASSTIYYCKNCNVPIFEMICPCCGSVGDYIATDIRPVFPEENALISLITKNEADYYSKSSVWFGSGSYIINGERVKIPISSLNEMEIDEIKNLKDSYDNISETLNYDYFNHYVRKFVTANKDRYNFIVDEAVQYIQSFCNDYSIDDMMVSFSGGKDSTVVSHLVCKALGSTSIVHIFGDTTLEFPYTLEYKDRFRNNSETSEIRIITAKNREKNFEELCQVVGPPSRVMRWCCTVFKTGAIQKTITTVFRNRSNVLSFQGIRRSESASRSKYRRTSESPKISKQTVACPIIDWKDFDVWLYILSTGIDFNDAYRLGWTRVGCWCCPNNGGWSEFLAKVHMYEKYELWNNLLINFARSIGKPDPETYVLEGGWKARQGGNGLDAAKGSIIEFRPCSSDEESFNFELSKPISNGLFEFFKPFGYINKDLGNKRLGEVFVTDTSGQIILTIQGKIGSCNLKVAINDVMLMKVKSLTFAKAKILCQLTKYQMCIGCKACESVCKHDAIIIRNDENGDLKYTINNKRCCHCGECVSHFNGGCYMRKVLKIKR